MKYTIKKGDTLTKISKEFGVSIADLVKANNIKNPDKIYYDKLLEIPENVKKPESPKINEKEAIEEDMKILTQVIGAAPHSMIPSKRFAFPVFPVSEPKSAPNPVRNISTQKELALKKENIVVPEQKNTPIIVSSVPPAFTPNIPETEYRPFAGTRPSEVKSISSKKVNPPSSSKKTTFKFKEARYTSPNIRDEQDSSYIYQHRPLVNSVKGIIFHHTGDSSINSATYTFQDPKSERSAHVVIGPDGERRIFADPTQIANHAGASVYNGREGLNDSMLGIEFVNDGKSPLTSEQIQSAIEYLTPIIAQYKIPKEEITTHKIVRNNYIKARKAGTLKTDAGKWSAKSDLSDVEFARIISNLTEKIYLKNEK